MHHLHALHRRAPALFATLLVLLGGSLFAWAQMEVGEARLIPYAGVLERDGESENGTFTFRFAFFTSPQADATCLISPAAPSCPLWSEEQDDIPVSGGRFSVVLGEAANITDAHLATAPLYLAVAVRADGDPGFTLMQGKTELLSVPFAARAAAAKNYQVTGTLSVGGSATVGGNASVGGTLSAGQTTLTAASDVGTLSGGVLTVRVPSSSVNIGIDNNEIMARDGNGAATLFLNNEGGIVDVGADLRLRKRLRLQEGVVEGISEVDAEPEVYRMGDVVCERGDVFIGRPSLQSNQDSLCACLLVDDLLSAWCFNP